MRYALACVLTVLLETPLFLLAGYRQRDEVTVVVCANVVTNLLLNVTVALLAPVGAAAVCLLEAAVVAAEYAIYALAFGRSKRLALLTLAANCFSFAAGLLIFRP